MQALADTHQLVKDGVITPDQAAQIEDRARDTMMRMVINIVLTGGIFASTIGLIAFLADARSVAGLGAGLLILGALILNRKSDSLTMFGQAATLIGAGMLIGGFGTEMLLNHEQVAGPAALIAGIVVALPAAWIFRRPTQHPFVIGSIFIMGVALHLAGCAFWLDQAELVGWSKALFLLYGAVAIAASGLFVDVRFITALAIIPFAQILDANTRYYHAAYAFYSKESTLSILQMTGLIVLALLTRNRWGDRVGRHITLLAIIAFIVANMCALVGSLWGDVVGENLWGQHTYWQNYPDYETAQAAREAFEATTLVISEQAYAILWALALVAVAAFAAHRGLRGLLNTAVTFGAIHAYTQMFESYADQPLAYVIAGLTAIPLAWGMWRLNTWLALRTNTTTRI